MAARTPRRTFATPFVVTLAAVPACYVQPAPQQPQPQPVAQPEPQPTDSHPVVVVNPPRPGRLREWHYDGQRVELARGAEMGRFLLGSTVVLLWPQGPLRFRPGWVAGAPVRVGQGMADAA